MSSLRSMMLAGVLTAAALVVVTTIVQSYTATQEWPCETHKGLTPICAEDLEGTPILSPEDIVGVPGQDWIIISEFGRKNVYGRLTALNEATFERRILKWEVNARAGSECTPPDFDAFKPHGIDLSEDGRTLLVINHQPTDRVEYFDVVSSATGGISKLIWTDCVYYKLDGEYQLNDLVLLSDGGFVATRMWPSAWYNGILFVLRYPNGWVDRWHPDRGWEEVKGTRMAFPNGVEVSEDEKTLYVAEFRGDKLLAIDLETGERLGSAKVDLMPDNLSWSTDGSLLYTAGARHDVIKLLKCQAIEEGNCDQPYGVVALDPESFATKEVLVRDQVKVYGSGTVAVERGDFIWIGSHQSDRLARYSLR